jgi:hypothetical protein
MQAHPGDQSAHAPLTPGGASPSGKAPVFGTGIPRFESWRPSQCLFQWLASIIDGETVRYAVFVPSGPSGD